MAGAGHFSHLKGQSLTKMINKLNLLRLWKGRSCFQRNVWRTLTLRLLRDGHTQPLQVDAVLAADTGRPAAKRVERDGSYDQRQLQIQLWCSRNVNTDLKLEKPRFRYMHRERSVANRIWIVCEVFFTLSMYSTLMMRHWRIEGPTGGILMARPCQVSRRLAPTMSPHRVATTERFCLIVPRAMKVCVCVM